MYLNVTYLTLPKSNPAQLTKTNKKPQEIKRNDKVKEAIYFGRKPKTKRKPKMMTMIYYEFT